jgi:hypothetical protein
MKIAVQCESPLLQRSLELFLAPYLSTFKQCDVVVRDRRMAEDAKPSLVVSAIGGDLAKPFSRSQLMLALEQMLDRGRQAKEAVAITEALEEACDAMESPTVTHAEGVPDFALLEQRLEELSREYQQNVMKAVRSFYEK